MGEEGSVMWLTKVSRFKERFSEPKKKTVYAETSIHTPNNRYTEIERDRRLIDDRFIACEIVRACVKRREENDRTWVDRTSLRRDVFFSRCK